MHPKHHRVRELYQRRCGYCDTSEEDAGGELTVDHFQPESCGGTDEIDNLVYACHRCNGYKGAYWPTPSGFRLLHPILEPLQDHIVEEPGTGILIALTPRGTLHIELLHLNREALVAQRLRLASLDALARDIVQVARLERDEIARIENLERYKRMLEWATGHLRSKHDATEEH